MSRPLHVTQFLLFESGTYNEQFRRPITTAVQGHQIARVQEATQYGANLSPVALSRVASEILMPCTEVEGGSIVIPYGWSSKRFYFILEISTGQTQRGGYRKVLSGYTDVFDISHGGHLPPDMCLHINSHLTLRDVQVPGPHGVQYQTTIVNNDQILVGQYQRMLHQSNDHSLRPYDVVRRLGTTQMLQSEDDGAINFDYTTTFAQGIKTNARKNTNPGTYMSRLLTACKESQDLQENQYLDHASAVFDSAAGVLAETTFSDDDVFMAFNRATDFANTGFITLMQLEQLSPGAEANAVIHKHGGVHAMKPLSMTGDSQHWQGQNQETVIATRLAQAIPGILLDSALNKMSVVMTNMNHDGSTTVMPVDHTIGSTIKGIDLVRQAEIALTRIRHELMPGLTQNNMVGVYIIVDCDTFSDTRIKVSIEGGHYEEFTSPTFADSLIAPVVTSDLSKVERLVNDVHNLSSNLGYASSMQPAPKIYQGGQGGAGSQGSGFGGRFR